MYVAHFPHRVDLEISTLKESVAICCGTYGVGSWLRLAAGRLERFENSTRFLEPFIAS